MTSMGVNLPLAFAQPALSLRQKEAVLTAIAKTANGVCERPSEAGSDTIIAGEISTVADKASSLGLTTAIRFRDERWFGPLKKDIAVLVQDYADCKNHVFDRMNAAFFSTYTVPELNRFVTIDSVENVGGYDDSGGTSEPPRSSLTYQFRGAFTEAGGSTHAILQYFSEQDSMVPDRWYPVVRMRDDVGTQSPVLDGDAYQLRQICIDQTSGQAVVVLDQQGEGSGETPVTTIGYYANQIHAFAFDKIGNNTPDINCTQGQNSNIPSGPYPKTMNACSCDYVTVKSVMGIADRFAGVMVPMQKQDEMENDQLVNGQSLAGVSSSALTQLPPFMPVDDADVQSFISMLVVLPPEYQSRFKNSTLTNGNFTAMLIQYHGEMGEGWSSIIGRDQTGNTGWKVMLFDPMGQQLHNMHREPELLAVTADGQVRMSVCKSGGTDGVVLSAAIADGALRYERLITASDCEE